ncbi:hypothetical protein [Geotalea sp. SG265]|uniref:hypothetical protein n=1 Tax=Geotalea sp. SG265 TaxID=2922867 RepID=UPI001FAF9AD2|nr:hypothetical protein [Geotalea sp. SG265]
MKNIILSIFVILATATGALAAVEGVSTYVVIDVLKQHNTVDGNHVSRERGAMYGLGVKGSVPVFGNPARIDLLAEGKVGETNYLDYAKGTTTKTTHYNLKTEGVGVYPVELLGYIFEPLAGAGYVFSGHTNQISNSSTGYGITGVRVSNPVRGGLLYAEAGAVVPMIREAKIQPRAEAGMAFLNSFLNVRYESIQYSDVEGNQVGVNFGFSF